MNNFLMVIGVDYKEFKYLCVDKISTVLKISSTQ